MAVQKIAINNFTVFKKTEIEFCDGINVFIGENGTGKTHLLKLIYLICKYRSTNPPYLTSLIDLFGIGFDVGNCEATSVITDEILTAEGVEPEAYIPITLSFQINGKNDKYIRQQETNAEIRMEAKALKSPVFIPTKEVFSMHRITKIADEYKTALNIDATLTEIINKAENIIPDNPSELAKKLAPAVEEVIGGQIYFNEKYKLFWVRKSDGLEFPLSSEAEGFKKLGLLWQLLMNRSITENTILLWDEPDANLNPGLTSVAVNILLELSRHGVQVFLATHDYNLMKYFSIKRKNNDNLAFFSLYKTENGVSCEREDDYNLLENNAIVDANIQLYKDDVERVLG